MTDNNQNGQQEIQIPDFVLGFIGKLQLENELLKGEIRKLQQAQFAQQSQQSQKEEDGSSPARVSV